MGLYSSVIDVGNTAHPIQSNMAVQQRQNEVFGNGPLTTGDPIYKASREKVVSKFFMVHPYTKRRNEVVYVSSSNVVSAAYDSAAQVLMIEFRRHVKGGKPAAGGGPRYEYAGVSDAAWQAFKRAPSKGKFVWGFLRRRGVPYRRVR